MNASVSVVPVNSSVFVSPVNGDGTSPPKADAEVVVPCTDPRIPYLPVPKLGFVDQAVPSYA